MSEPIQSIAQNNYILQAPPPTATMFTTELEYDGDKISGYAGSAFKAGTDLEFGYDSADNISAINNSALTDVNLNNIVQTNSGAWGGSALPISAGPGIKFEMVNNTLVASTDETVLWSGSDTTATQTLSENITAFEEIKVYGKSHNLYPWISQVWVNSGVVYGVGSQMWWNVPPEYDISRYCLSGDKIIPMKGSWYTWANGTTATTGDLTGNADQLSYICKVIGINRIAGGN